MLTRVSPLRGSGPLGVTGWPRRPKEQRVGGHGTELRHRDPSLPDGHRVLAETHLLLGTASHDKLGQEGPPRLSLADGGGLGRAPHVLR